MVDNRGPVTEGVTLVAVVLASIFVAARIFTRLYIVRQFKQEDWWILAAWLVALGFSTSICVGVRFGLGKHRDDVSEAMFAMQRKAEYAFAVMYNPSLMLTKTSIIVFYLSVMSRDVDPVFKWLNWFTLALVNIAGLALTFLNIFQCSPVSVGYTYPTPAQYHCTDIVTLYQSSAPVNIITGIAILLLPMPILTGMRLPKKQKIILLFTFGFGIFVVVIDVIRIAALQDAALDRLTVMSNGSGSPRIVESNDFPWYASLSFMWSAVEVNIGIICACVPCLKPLFSKFLPSFIRDNGELTPTASAIGLDNGDGKSRPIAIDANPLNNPAAFRSPSCADYLGDDEGDHMGFLNMLAGPPEDGATLNKQTTRLPSMLSRVSTTKSMASDFDFVSMGGPKNMLKLTNRQSVWPVAVVTVIFFLWGFAYGLLSTLNAQFQTVAHLTTGQAHGLSSAYFCGYLVGPLTIGRFVLRRYGFRAAMMAGLCIYGCGTLIFWPAAVLLSYPAFVASNFIVASGLSCLEIAANPYTALCGPLEYAEVRLNLSQAFQAIGTVVSGLMANKVFFTKQLAGASLLNVQWAYLGIALFVFALAIVFYYIHLPEATDDQFEEQAERRSAVYGARVGPWPVIWVTLALGVFSQWCYVGAQEGVSNFAGDLFAIYEPEQLTTFDWITIAHTLFALGRFIAAFLNYILTPRWILMFLYTGVTICAGLLMRLRGNAGAAILLMAYFFEAGIFSIIFAISMRGMGSSTKTASAFMTAAISGGAVIPIIQWVVSYKHTINGADDYPYSFSVVAAIFAFGAIFPIYLNFVPAARKQVDPLHEKDRHHRRAARRQSTFSDAGAPTRQFGLIGIVARRRKQKLLNANMPTSEHVERSSDNNDSPTRISHSFHEKLQKIVDLPSPIYTAGHFTRKHRQKSEVSPGGDASSANSSLDSHGLGLGLGFHEKLGHAGSSSNDGGEYSPGEPPEPQPRREWTEKDDMIDDYHNALKDI